MFRFQKEGFKTMKIPANIVATATLTVLAIVIATLAIGSFTAEAQGQPGTINNLSLTSISPGEFTITWDTPNPVPSDYRLRWAEESLDFLSHSAPNEANRGSEYPEAQDTSITLTDLTKGSTFKVQIRTRYTSGGENDAPWSGPWTTAATQRVKDDLPATPTGLSTSQVTHDSVTLSWTAPSRGTITGYRVLRGADANSLSATVADTGSTDTQYTDQNVVAETTYVYAVQALSPDGDSAQSQTATAITSAPPTPTAEPTTEPPPPPASDEVTGLALSSETAGELVITWNTPTDEPTDYRVSWAPADEEYLPFSEENTTRLGNSYPSGDTTTLTLTGLPEGISYRVIIRARYEGASGPWTAEATQTIQAAEPVSSNPPAAPTGLRTLATDAEVTLVWDDPADDSITGYQVWRGPEAASLQVLAADTGSASNSYLDDAVEPETTYHYAVSAINADGTSQQSDTISATTQAAPEPVSSPPAAPTGLRTLTTDQEITLVWDDPADDSITGYEIWRGPKAASLQVLSADTGNAANSYLDDTVEAETTYHYAINAINAINPDGTSQQSDTISATTQAAPQEGETISAQQSDAPTLAVSNLDPFSVSNLLLANTAEWATSFTTGSDPTYVLRGARLRVSADTSIVFTVAIHDDSSNSPGTIQHTLTHPDTVDQATSTIEEFTADETPTLTGDTKYWIVVKRVSGTGDLRVRSPGSTDVDAGGLPGWSIGGTQFRANSSNDWITTTRMAIGVLAQWIPQLTEVEITSKPLDGTTYKAGENVEIEFTFNIPVTYKGGVAAIRIGAEPNSYRSAGYVGGSGTKKLLYRYKVKLSEQDGNGIGVDGSALGGVATDKIVDANGNVVTLATSGLNKDLDHKVAGNTVGCRDVLCTDMTVHVQSITPMTVLGAFYYPDKSPEGLLSNRSFHLSQNYVIRQVVLRNNNKLELLLDRPPTQQLLTQGEFYIAGTLHSFTDATVDGNKITWPVTGLVWPEGQEIRINLRDNVLVSNTGQTTSQSNAAITRPDRLAQQFTTGNRANGYKIDVVNLGLEIGDGSGAVVRVAIYSDNSDAPGASKHVLTNPATIDGDADTFEKFTATDVILNSRTKYWLVVQRVSGTSNVSIRSTSSADEDTTTDAGWSVNGSIWRTDTNEVWEQVAILGTLNMKMSIQGEESNITSPAFTKSAETLSVTENAQHDTSLGTITANDPDGDELEYTVTGTDADDFTNVLSFDRLTGEIKARRVSGFDHTKIDYETKASYSVIINVTDGEDITGATEPTATIDDTIAVTITVTDVEETGTVILSRETPLTGVCISFGNSGVKREVI